jgi:hypothetical protein
VGHPRFEDLTDLVVDEDLHNPGLAEQGSSSDHCGDLKLPVETVPNTPFSIFSGHFMELLIGRRNPKT